MQRYDNSTSLGVPDMRYAFTATPSVFDLDFDGYADVVYAADLGGNVWKWVIHDDVLDPINGSRATSCTTRPTTTGRSSRSSRPASAGRAPRRPQGLHGAPLPQLLLPADGRARGRDAVARARQRRAQQPAVHRARRLPQKNRFYVFKDQDPLERELTGSTSTPRFTDASPSTDFVNVTSLSGACNPPPSPAVGFYVEARPRREVHHRHARSSSEWC